MIKIMIHGERTGYDILLSLRRLMVLKLINMHCSKSVDMQLLVNWKW